MDQQEGIAVGDGELPDNFEEFAQGINDNDENVELEQMPDNSGYLSEEQNEDEPEAFIEDGDEDSDQIPAGSGYLSEGEDEEEPEPFI